jgi:hypothetical protein
VLLVQFDRLGDGVVADDVAVGQVFGEDARARLVFLVDVVLIFFGFDFGGGGASQIVDRRGCFDVDGRGAELGLVEEEGGFGRAAWLLD